ncbi:hypothetical protein DAI22_12g119201 [Oryza sativa Japonica Group]|nr:hypothetical protein DAI22_12g119201 [Oryza sativa Japonica Group]
MAAATRSISSTVSARLLHCPLPDPSTPPSQLLPSARAPPTLRPTTGSVPSTVTVTARTPRSIPMPSAPPDPPPPPRPPLSFTAHCRIQPLAIARDPRLPALPDSPLDLPPRHKLLHCAPPTIEGGVVGEAGRERKGEERWDGRESRVGSGKDAVRGKR